MNKEKNSTRKNNRQESGAALITVLMISVLLLTIACVALLSAAGANSRNTTDVLSETKAYYAAESGIQATVNALRYTSLLIDYKTAHNSGNLAAYLTYDYTNPNDASDKRIVIGQTASNYAANTRAGTAYSVFVSDPDNSQIQTKFTTFAGFSLNNVTFTASHTFAGASANQFTKIEWVPNNPNPTTVNFTADEFVNSALGSFRVTNGTAGGATVTDLYFEIYYRVVRPDNPTISIKGKINGSNKQITLNSLKYKLLGSTIDVCGMAVCPNSANNYNVTFPVGSGSADTIVYGKMNPREPQRLVLKSVGYGPNGARKELEAILQKNLVNGLNSASAISLLGPAVNPNNPNDTAVFLAGSSNVMTYTGSSSCGINVPAFGFVDPTNLINAQTYITNNLTPNGQNAQPQVSPPPAMLSYELPEWQRTPGALAAQVQIYRDAAFNISRIFPNGSSIANPGSNVTGGITFCDGNCTVSGSNGGGILVVKGTLSSLGGFDFKGTIIVVGPGGWERAGGGGGQITGNVVIAPYTMTPTPMFLPPKYKITGGGASDIIFAGIDDLFLGENSAISNHIVGVSEK